jgi:hypothetical protein
MNRLTKDEMVRRLVAHSVKTALAESKPYWLNELFERGFAGYRNLSRGQLVAELQMRGLGDDESGDSADDAFDADDDFDLDDLELDINDYSDSSLGLQLRAGEMD